MPKRKLKGMSVAVSGGLFKPYYGTVVGDKFYPYILVLSKATGKTNLLRMDRQVYTVIPILQ